ncbi:MAG: apolipoprotein N-acyltransferase [Pseudomonadota bacterium]
MKRALRRFAARIRTAPGWLRALVLFATGAISVVAHAPFHFQPVLAVALVVLVLFLDDARRTRHPLRAGFWRAWCFSAGMFLAGTSWVANAFLVNAAAHVWLIWMPLIALPGGLALIWGAAGALYVRLSKPGPTRIAVFTACFIAAELFRSTALSGFPWNLPGHIWPAGGYFSQIASLIGAAGLSFITLFAFTSLAALWGRGPRLARALPPSLGALLLVGVFSFGAARLSTAESEVRPGQMLRLVQVRIDQADKVYENRGAILERYLELSAAGGFDGVSAVIWPEVAIPAYLQQEPELVSRISEVFEGGPPLLMGAARYEFAEDAELFFNSFFVLEFSSGAAEITGVYDKTRLVPIGEGNPIRWATEAFGLTTLSTIAPFFTPGSEPRVLESAGLPAFAPLICYEAIYPRYAITGAKRPSWLLNVSNDAWFGHSSGPIQLMGQAQYRAVESGLPVVRSALAGVSGLIDPYGRPLAALPIDAEKTIDIPIVAELPETFYARHGDAPWLGIAIMLLTMVQLLLVLITKRVQFHP